MRVNLKMGHYSKAKGFRECRNVEIRLKAIVLITYLTVLHTQCKLVKTVTYASSDRLVFSACIANFTSSQLCPGLIDFFCTLIFDRSVDSKSLIFFGLNLGLILFELIKKPLKVAATQSVE